MLLRLFIPIVYIGWLSGFRMKAYETWKKWMKNALKLESRAWGGTFGQKTFSVLWNSQTITKKTNINCIREAVERRWEFQCHLRLHSKLDDSLFFAILSLWNPVLDKTNKQTNNKTLKPSIMWLNILSKKHIFIF